MTRLIHTAFAIVAVPIIVGLGLVWHFLRSLKKNRTLAVHPLVLSEEEKTAIERFSRWNGSFDAAVAAFKKHDRPDLPMGYWDNHPHMAFMREVLSENKDWSKLNQLRGRVAKLSENRS